eukprot:GHVO01022291.1.p1 GENE.GHVO01022291.1~~GHVO01022291.1.p1  ORF type:complete len:238 (+),score=87.65 GHVO01022291.1:261-974(+)
MRLQQDAPPPSSSSSSSDDDDDDESSSATEEEQTHSKTKPKKPSVSLLDFEDSPPLPVVPITRAPPSHPSVPNSYAPPQPRTQMIPPQTRTETDFFATENPWGSPVQPTQPVVPHRVPPMGHMGAPSAPPQVPSYPGASNPFASNAGHQMGYTNQPSQYPNFQNQQVSQFQQTSQFQQPSQFQQMPQNQASQFQAFRTAPPPSHPQVPSAFHTGPPPQGSRPPPTSDPFDFSNLKWP